MGMSDFYGPSNDADSMAVLDRAVELGVTFWDTADMYAAPTRRCCAGSPPAGGPITLATKFGVIRGGPGERGVSGRPEYVKEACHYSLARLGVDVIDLYFQHRVDPAVPIEETVGAMADLVTDGKVRYLGLSEAGPETIRRAHAVHPIAALQSEWSLWSRDIEDSSVPVCRELGIGIVAYSPLGRGFLTGRLAFDSLTPRDFRANNPRMVGPAREANLRIVDAVAAVAARRGVQTGQVALAWVLARGEDVAPIPGTRRVPYLEQNAAAASITLTAEELAELDGLGANVVGERYPDMSPIGR
jgi:aryl-alcohol dehydrogenase-like predicted oxidoreductase